MVQQTPKPMGMEVIDGVTYANPLDDDRYLVKVFPLPKRDDLGAYIRLMESFERRFLHSADGGKETLRHVDDFEAYVAEKRKNYTEKTGGEKEIAGAALCVALLNRGIRQAKIHIKHRMNPEPHNTVLLADLSVRIQDDLMEAVGLFANVRRHRGHMDIDQVLNEMKGEPYNIFVGTLSGAQGNLEFFRANRMRKAATAMRCIDEVVDSVSALACSHKQLEDGGVLPMLKELGEAAKRRLQLQRDDPDFKAADSRLHVARNALMHFVPSGGKAVPIAHLPADYVGNLPVSPNTMLLIRDAGDLIFDVAMVRVPRDASAKDLMARVEEHQAHVGRGRRTGGV